MEKGDKGEYEIIRLLHQYGVEKVRIPDVVWLHPISKRWYYFEVKNKEPFEPPPDWLQGFPQLQFIKDIHIDASGLCCIYIVRGKDGGWLAQYANLLEPISNPPQANTEENLVWFPLSQFVPVAPFFQNELGLTGNG